MAKSISVTLAVSSLLLAPVVVNAAASVTIPATCAPCSQFAVDPQFQGFAFEEASFVEYAQGRPVKL